jgi:hypothetical protein
MSEPIDSPEVLCRWLACRTTPRTAVSRSSAPRPGWATTTDAPTATSGEATRSSLAGLDASRLWGPATARSQRFAKGAAFNKRDNRDGGNLGSQERLAEARGPYTRIRTTEEGPAASTLCQPHCKSCWVHFLGQQCVDSWVTSEERFSPGTSNVEI